MLLIPKLLTTFNVIRVIHEPHCESTWWLEYKGWGPIKCYEQLFDTIDEDEKLVGKYVEAQIKLTCDEIWKPAEYKKKYMTFQGNVINAVGQVMEEYPDHDEEDEYYFYFINSIFPFKASFSSEKQDLKPGDWISMSGEAYLILPRGGN